MYANQKSLYRIHLAVLLFGLSGLFGKTVDLPALSIVFGRVFFASLFLYIVLFYRKIPFKLSQRQDYSYMFLMGLLLAIHWSTFFLSIQLSTVAIGLLTFSTFPVFVTFLEPYFFNEKIKAADIVTAIITLFGIMLVVPHFELNNNLTEGALYGILSGLTYAFLSLLNRKYAVNYSGIVVAFYEQFIAALLLLPVFLIQQPAMTYNNLFSLLLLGTLFTGIAHSLFIDGLKKIKTQTAGIISCLEPVYGILFAALLLKEIPSLREILGGIIILSTVFYSTLQSKQQ